MLVGAAAEVNSLVSSETEVPFPYYSMPFCKPPEGVRKSANTVNPGTILLGIRIENSPYTFPVMVRRVRQLGLAAMLLARVWRILQAAACTFKFNTVGLSVGRAGGDQGQCCLQAAHLSGQCLSVPEAQGGQGEGDCGGSSKELPREHWCLIACKLLCVLYIV